MRALMAGDTHGSIDHCLYLVDTASLNACDVVVQVGDFGYWEHTSEGVRFLDVLARRCNIAGLLWYFVDGNHENHELLQRALHRRLSPDGFIAVRDSILWIPRGHRWEWNGVRFLGLGGAYSIDRAWRTEGLTWWPEEVISEADVAGACAGGDVDVLVSHDAPWGAQDIMGPDTSKDEGRYPESEMNRRRLRGVFDATHPRIVFHGHYHHRVTSFLEGAEIVGLDRDGTGPHSWTTFDTEELLASAGSCGGSVNG